MIRKMYGNVHGFCIRISLFLFIHEYISLEPSGPPFNHRLLRSENVFLLPFLVSIIKHHATGKYLVKMEISYLISLHQINLVNTSKHEVLENGKSISYQSDRYGYELLDPTFHKNHTEIYCWVHILL